MTAPFQKMMGTRLKAFILLRIRSESHNPLMIRAFLPVVG